MMIVQYVEFLEAHLPLKTVHSSSSVSPLSCIVSASLRFCVVVIYIHHFRRIESPEPKNVLWKLVCAGNMTNPKMRDIRYLSPFLL